ncbi:MAG: LysM domain-containing protein [Chloroflexi bacterium]|nr:LysM domain-containing protein [Chloroflexota bacterium]
MHLKFLLIASVAAGLLLTTGVSFAQNPSIRVSFSENPIQEGAPATVTMTFSGLPRNTEMRFHGCVRENFADCEGAGLGGVFNFFTGDSDTMTRTATIIGSCPIGSYHLDVDLRTASDAILTEKSAIFSVVDHYAAMDGAFQRLGGIGIIYRSFDPELNIEIWRVTPESEGYFLLRVTQSQIDAAQSAGLAASSPDGRAAVRVGAAPERNVIISMGPDREGKVHHVTLAHGLNGAVIGTTDTHSGPPGVLTSSTAASSTSPAASPYAPAVVPQSPLADDSIIHVVRTGDTIHAMAAAYGVSWEAIIERNQLTHGGRWIYPGQELIIRDASASTTTAAPQPTPVASDTAHPDLPPPVFKGDESE